MTAPGARVAGRYLLHSRLGGGAMGAVWLARDELLGRDVAVKQVLIPLGSDPEATAGHREAAMREGRIAARLTHPHAVAVYDMVDDGGTPWLVMEYLPSQSLAAVLAQRGTLPVQQVAQIGAQVADALVATHAVGVVHRDVKPGNILIGNGPRSAGLVKITDFGISRARGDVSLTQTGVVKGTPAYLAPEVARGQEPREASDVFSLGATLHACLEGTPPFGMTENPLEMLHRVAGGNVARPRNAGALTRPLLRMLANDPAKRPTMTQVRDQLAKLAAGRDGDVTEVLRARTPLLPTLADLRPVSDAALPGRPVITGSSASDSPATPFPAAASPATASRATASPVTDFPATDSPVIGVPTAGIPATGSTSAGPTTAGPTTAGPSTAGPSTAGPSTAGPSTAGPSATGSPSGAPPATDSAATDPPATGAPATGVTAAGMSAGAPAARSALPADTAPPPVVGSQPGTSAPRGAGSAAPTAGAVPTADQPTPSVPASRRGRRRSRLVAAVAVLLLALSGTLGAVWLGARDDDGEAPPAAASTPPPSPSSSEPAQATEEEPVVPSETPTAPSETAPRSTLWNRFQKSTYAARLPICARSRGPVSSQA
ncbi:protein kinase domain-containing protein, partial [Modestobacter marinus]|uniref:protein kinase domain-containing protein n=1 Tax=Modestobacter marinus TaxID=477641 RepID=UPI00201A5311